MLTVRTDGDWESRFNFFAEAVTATADQAVNTAHELINLTNSDRDSVTGLSLRYLVASIILTYYVVKNADMAAGVSLVKQVMILLQF